MENKTPIAIGSEIDTAGFITQFRYVQGRTLIELESTLGFEKGRFEKGIIAGFLLRIPTPAEFELYGYSHVAGHRWDDKDSKLYHDRRKLNISLLKKKLVEEIFTTKGQLSLVKIFPNIPHDSNKKDDEQYPSGNGGVPQWKLTNRLPIKIAAVIEDYPNGKLNLIS